MVPCSMEEAVIVQSFCVSVAKTISDLQVEK